MKSILITGGAGFIGSYLTETLYEKGYSITVLDNLSPQVHSKEKDSFLFRKVKDKCHFIQGSICDRNDWIKALKGIDTIVHLAAETGTGQSMYEVEHYYNVNVQGTALMLDILVNEQHSVNKMIIASSRAIYGEGKYNSENLGYNFRNIEARQTCHKVYLVCWIRTAAPCIPYQLMKIPNFIHHRSMV